MPLVGSSGVKDLRSRSQGDQGQISYGNAQHKYAYQKYEHSILITKARLKVTDRQTN